MSNEPPFKKTSFSIPLSQVARLGKAADYVAAPATTPSGRVFNYDASPQDWACAQAIVTRAVELGAANGHEISGDLLLQDLMTVHCIVAPLKLLQLLMSGNDDFTHDVLGVGLHLDKRAGVFLNGFKPRFAERIN